MGTVRKTYNVWDAQIQRGILNFSLSVTNQTNGIRVEGYVEVRGADLPLSAVRIYMPDNTVINAVYAGDTTSPVIGGNGVSNYLGKYTFSGSASVPVNSAYSVRVVGENGSTSTVTYRFISPDESNFVSEPELSYEDVLAEPVNCSISLRANNVYAPGGSVVINCSSTGPVDTGVLKRYYTEPGSGSGSSFKSTVIRSNVIGNVSVTDTIPSNLSGAIVYWRYDVSGTSGSAYAVTGERRISSNSAPSTPETLTIPNSLAVGSAFQISWSESTDPDNNLAGYILERSVDSGESWVTVFKGNALSCSDTLPQYTTRVRYQVRAYDTENAESGPRYAPSSGDATVSTNHAPTTPETLTITPATLGTGVSAVISWGESTDEDTGDTIVYSLERSVNNSSSYQEIYRGTSRTRTDTIGEWTKVYYRVRAIDNHGAASDYKSVNRAVSSNAAPVLTVTATYNGATLSGDNWGSLDHPPSVMLEFADDNTSDTTLTVKEYMDGTVRKSFTLTRNSGGVFPQKMFSWKNSSNVAYWNTLSLGSHTLKVEVSDGQATDSEEFTFTKSTGSCVITLTSDIDATTGLHPGIGALSINGYIPDDILSGENGQFEVKMKCDSGWEDCVAKTTDAGYTEYGRKKGSSVNVNAVLEGGNYIFLHKFGTAGSKYNFQITLNSTGSSEAGKAHVDSIQYAFTEVSSLEDVTFDVESSFPNYSSESAEPV